MPDITVYKDLAEKQNYDAIVELATDSFTRVIYNEPNSMAEKDTFEAFVEDLLSHEPNKAPSEKNVNIFKSIMTKLNEKYAANTVAIEKSIRENIKKINNGEIAELSLLNHDQKKVRKAAETLTFSQTSNGINQQAYFTLMNSVQTHIPNDLANELGISGGAVAYDCNEAVKNALVSELNITQAELEGKPIINDLMKAEFSNVEKYNFSQTPVNAGEKIVVSTDRSYEDIKKLDDHELVKALANKEKELEVFKAATGELLELANDGKALKDAVSKIQGFNSQAPAASAFSAELENLTKYGTLECAYEYSIDLYSDKTAINYSNKVTTGTYNTMLKALKKKASALEKEYAGQETDEAKAALQASKLAEDFVTAHAEKLKALKANSAKQLDNPETEIEIIRQEQQNRLLSNEDYRAIAKDCALRDQKINQIGRYIDKAQRGLNILSNAAEWMTADKQTHGHPSTSYTNFATAMAELKDMSAGGTTPDELLAKMQQTYDAAVAYEQQHTQGWHPFTGLTDKGKDRIRYSRLAKDVLGKKIAELTPMVEKLKPQLDGMRPENRKTVLEMENQNDRQIMNETLVTLKEQADRSKAEKQTAGDFLDKQISDAQNALKNAKEQAGEGSYPDKEAFKAQYAKVITAMMLKVASNRSKYVPKTDGFENLCKKTEDSAGFDALVKGSTPEQLYKAATVKEGQQLFQNFTNARADIKQAEANANDKQPAQPAKGKDGKAIGTGM